MAEHRTNSLMLVMFPTGHHGITACGLVVSEEREQVASELRENSTKYGLEF